jgi:hypothetical protein
MNIEELIDRLEANAEVIAALVRNLPAESVSWKPSPEKWSILEVAAHLLDEEREDFRARIDSLLHRPDQEWSPIDPPGWVEERGYASRDLAETVRDFLSEREHSISWLRRLEAPNWQAAYQHPTLGQLRAGDLLASWLAHDFLHIRQLTGLHWQFHRHLMEPFEVSYAGNW